MRLSSKLAFAAVAVLGLAALLLVGFAVTVPVAAHKGGFFSDEATYYAMAYSLAFDGDIRYEGCATALARGRSMEGEMGVSFSFTYVLRPEEL